MIDNLVTEDVLEPRKAAIWTSLCFVIPKKNGDLSFLTDFRELNKYIKREEWPTERIEDTIDSVGRFTRSMSIDLIKGYHTLRLSEQACQLCRIILLWGIYCYKCLPQGIKIATNVFQRTIGRMFSNLPNMHALIIALFSKVTFNKHVKDA